MPPASPRVPPDFSAAVAPPSQRARAREPPVHARLAPRLAPTYSLPSLDAPRAVPYGATCSPGPRRACSREEYLARARKLLQIQPPCVPVASSPRSGAMLAAAVRETFAVRFTWTAPAERAVFLAGSFNGWGLPVAMTRCVGAAPRGDGDVWESVLRLPVGEYHYKYVVDGEWAVDAARLAVPVEGHGMANRLIIEAMDKR